MLKRILLFALLAGVLAVPAYTAGPPIEPPGRCHLEVDISWDDQTFTVTGTCGACDVLLDGTWEFIDEEMVEICLAGSLECDGQIRTVDTCITLPSEALNIRVLRRTSHLTVALLTP